ncbi:hypothetical protein [Nocardioides acrostichi]|uniref:Uncharacterized protein n=1 Tax=Nocardioides acrostichi TaxID=2784339 RepID=A0A930V1S4_9ACTN|nr:hypothetical protein [Nocardioides acrostichi]MBF4161629.1 hypothetical protein [Nocardioides acrostichi]
MAGHLAASAPLAGAAPAPAPVDGVRVAVRRGHLSLLVTETAAQTPEHVSRWRTRRETGRDLVRDVRFAVTALFGRAA